MATHKELLQEIRELKQKIETWKYIAYQIGLESENRWEEIRQLKIKLEEK